MEILNSIGLSIIAFIFVLGVLIFIHELGHYMVAKYLGIRVDVFSLGFGPRLFGFRKGETDYQISLLPLGGYVKMAGENPEEELTGSPDEFLSRPKRHRFAVAVAGPIMNIGLAIVLVAANFMMGTQVFSYLSQPAVVGVVKDDSPAKSAGIQVGDHVLSIDGEKTPTWRDVEFKIVTSPDLPLAIEIERNGERVFKDVVAKSIDEAGIGDIGIEPFEPYTVSGVMENSPAQEAGLQAGDEILSVKDSRQEGSGFHEIAAVISRSEGRPLQFEIRRDGEILEHTITPALNEGRAYIGAYLERATETRQFGPLEALGRSVEENFRLSRLTFTIVGRIVTGKASVKQMSGPIEIARYSGRAASLGWMTLLMFMAMVSLQLGIFNLLPIPILDGGVIALLAVEGVLGRDLSLRAKERIFKVGFVFLVLLMGVVIFNDIAKNI